MPEADFHLAKGDRSSSITDTLKDSAGAAVDIQGATVNFVMRKTTAAPGTTKVSAAATNSQVGTGSDGSKGKVAYDWAAVDVDTAGLFLARWRVTFANGKRQSFPNDRWILVRVSNDG